MATMQIINWFVSSFRYCNIHTIPGLCQAGYYKQLFERNYFTASFKFDNKHKMHEAKIIQED